MPSDSRAYRAREYRCRAGLDQPKALPRSIRSHGSIRFGIATSAAHSRVDTATAFVFGPEALSNDCSLLRQRLADGIYPITLTVVSSITKSVKTPSYQVAEIGLG